MNEKLNVDKTTKIKEVAWIEKYQMKVGEYNGHNVAIITTDLGTIVRM